MREILLKGAKAYYIGLINKHISNVEVLLTKPVGISGVDDRHQDIQEAIEKELGIIADYNDKVEVLVKFFERKENNDNQQGAQSEKKK